MERGSAKVRMMAFAGTLGSVVKPYKCPLETAAEI